MRLRSKTHYRNGARGLDYPPGTEFDATPELAAYLMADSPGCFEEVVEEEVAPSEPLSSKRVRKPPRDKAVKAPPEEK
jgi:hypothetical protein